MYQEQAVPLHIGTFFNKQKLPFKINKGTKIYLNFGKDKTLLKNSNVKPFVWLYNKNDVLIGSINSTGVYNITLTDDVFTFSLGVEKIKSGKVYNEKLYIVLTIEQVTDFIPHKNEVYNLPIQQPMLSGDTFVKEDGNWFEVHGWEKYYVTGEESGWRLYGDRGEYNGYLMVNETFADAIEATTSKEQYCNYFPYSSTTKKNTFRITNYSNSQKLWFEYENTNINTLEQFLQLLKDIYNSENKLYIWYKKKTPTKLACTLEQTAVLEQLNNTNTYRPITNIFTMQDLANLKLSYVADSKIYVDNKINAMQANLNTINQLLSTTGTSALLLNNMQTDLESEVM